LCFDGRAGHCAGGRIIKIIEGHEDEEETFQKTSELLRTVPDVVGIYVNTVNCLPVCRALGANGLAGKVKLIATDLFLEMSPHFQQGTITASIYQQPHRQGQVAVRVMVEHLANRVKFPAKVHFSPGVVMASNLHLFREMRWAEARLELPPKGVPSTGLSHETS
jgi:LacI family transcriptional regulator